MPKIRNKTTGEVKEIRDAGIRLSIGWELVDGPDSSDEASSEQEAEGNSDASKPHGGKAGRS